MEFLQYLGMGFIVGCLFVVIAVEIGRAIKKKKEVRNALFESIKMGKTTFDPLASALRAYKIPKLFPVDKIEIVWTNDDVIKARAESWAKYFNDNNMIFACGSSGWVKDNVFNSKIDDYTSTVIFGSARFLDDLGNEYSVNEDGLLTRKDCNNKVSQKKDEKQFIAESERHKPNCKHDEYLKELSGELDKMSLTFIERHYIYTTVFSYLHHDKDHCDCNE